MYLLFNILSRLVISCGSLYNQDIYVSLPVTMTDCWQYAFMVSTILSHLSTQCNHFSADILFYFFHSLKLFKKASLLSINVNSNSSLYVGWFTLICSLIWGPCYYFYGHLAIIYTEHFGCIFLVIHFFRYWVLLFSSEILYPPWWRAIYTY